VLLAVDGNSITHRAYHAYAGRGVVMTDGAGRPRGAVYGAVALVAGCAQKVVGRYGRIDGLVVGFDDPQRSVRREHYPDYKATRAAKDPALVEQLEATATLLAELGVTTLVPEGYEADDVLASAAAAAEQAGWRCAVATSDRDACALVTDATTMLRITGGLDQSPWLDPDGVVDSFGVSPSRYGLYAATRGDSSDNLPGVPGLGPKRAAALWSTYPDLATALADPDGLARAVGRRGAAGLLEHASVVERNVALMTLRTDITVAVDTVRPEWAAPSVDAVLVRWGLAGLTGRVAALAGLFGSRGSTNGSPGGGTDGGPAGQLPLFSGRP